jgi:hypothetical protein
MKITLKEPMETMLRDVEPGATFRIGHTVFMVLSLNGHHIGGFDLREQKAAVNLETGEIEILLKLTNVTRVEGEFVGTLE